MCEVQVYRPCPHYWSSVSCFSLFVVLSFYGKNELSLGKIWYKYVLMHV
jgi:hypothetical protein